MIGYLNELSLPRLESYKKVNELFGDFANVYKELSNHNVNTIKVKSDFLDHLFADSCTFYSWSQEPETDRDLSTLLVSLLTTAPYIEQIFHEYEVGEEVPMEFSYNNVECLGFGLASAAIHDTFSFSFPGNSFDQSQYQIVIKYLEEVEGELLEITERSIVRNISSSAHVGLHLDFFKSAFRNTVSTGVIFWRDRSTLFPNLIFCGQVEKQIEQLNLSHAEFTQILKRIFELDLFVSQWDRSNIKPSDFLSKVTPESLSRLNRLERQLTVLCPDGYSRLFNWHARYTPGSGRIYFFPVKESKKFIIGSIALKIP